MGSRGACQPATFPVRQAAKGVARFQQQFPHRIAQSGILAAGFASPAQPFGDRGLDARRLARRSPFAHRDLRSEEHTSELQSLMRISYAVFCLKKKKKTKTMYHSTLTKT